MGADEQFGGYARHRTAFNKGGWLSALVQVSLDPEEPDKGDLNGRDRIVLVLEYCLLSQVEQDVRRISTRNLGRDDRCVGDHGREGRYPFLDEAVVDFASSLPLHIKVKLLLLSFSSQPSRLLSSFRPVTLRQTFIRSEGWGRNRSAVKDSGPCWDLNCCVKTVSVWFSDKLD